MSVVVIGSEGFIGSAVVRHCSAAGIDVVTLDSVTSARPGHRVVDISSADLADALPDDASTVVHLAAISRDRDCVRDPVTAVNVNVGGTWNVFECARRKQIPQLIFASTEWVYGDVGGQAEQREDDPIDANRLTSVYALSKLFAERMLFSGWQQTPTTVVTVLRFAIVYGPRPANWSAVEQLFHQVRRADRVEVGSLQTARRFIHVQDIARGIVSAFGCSGYTVLNLSGPRLVTLADVIDASSVLLKRRPTVVESGASPTTVRNPSNEKAHGLLGWRPEIDLSAGLESLLEPIPR